MEATRCGARRSVLARVWPTLLTGSLLGAGATGLVFLPSLAASAPLLLIALRPTISVLVLVGGQVAFVPALLVATVFRALLDVGYFGLARYNVRSLLLRRVGTSRLVTALSRRSAQRGLLWFCLVNTNLAVDAALGAGAVPMRRFLRFLIPGSALSSALYLAAGSSLAPWTREVVRWLDEHASMLMLGAIGLAALQTTALLAARRVQAARQARQARHAQAAVHRTGPVRDLSPGGGQKACDEPVDAP
ncbi:hypothetical protein MXD63_06845 [Frankia sp. Cpl3]|nr:hypothetical protein [Frankia sp. Cpl3]